MSLIRGWHRSWPYNRWPDEPFELNRNSPQAEGLVAWWPALGSRGAGKLFDYGGRGLDGTFPGGTANPTWMMDGQLGSVLSFDGDDYVSLNSAFWLGNLTQYTISLWFSVDDVSTSQMLYNQSYTGSVNPVVALYVRSSEVALFHRDDAATGGYPAYPIANNVLYHAVGVRKAVDHFELFVDGISRDTDTTSKGTTTLDIEQLGRHLTGVLYLDGFIGDVRIHNVALPPSVIHQMWAPQTRWELYKPLRRFWSVKPSAAEKVSFMYIL